MDKALWTDVDRYLAEKVLRPDPVMDSVLRANASAGLPTIEVAPTQGKFVHLLARMKGAKRILEIGTLGGYSTIWLARALPQDGSLVSLEFSSEHAEVARANIANAGFGDVVEVRVGAALDSLKQMEQEAIEPFDFIFIDADKENYAGYLEGAIRFSQVGTVIVADNVIRSGGVADPRNEESRVQGVRRFFDLVTADKRLDATALQTVGSKGYDGFALVLVTSL
jgi:predicted O-methyltransferase YrrM